MAGKADLQFYHKCVFAETVQVCGSSSEEQMSKEAEATLQAEDQPYCVSTWSHRQDDDDGQAIRLFSILQVLLVLQPLQKTLLPLSPSTL